MRTGKTAQNVTIAWTVVVVLMSSSTLAGASDSASERTKDIRQAIEEIKNKLDQQAELKERLERLEDRLDRVQHFRQGAESKHFHLTQRVKRIEKTYPTEEVGSAEDDIRFGGAFWVNFAFQNFDSNDRAKQGEFTFDLFRLSAEGSRGNVVFSAQYRFYGYMNTVHHAWVGYNFTPNWQTRVGITKVPFGILPSASHSYWFGIPYYLGLEDDYDAGARVIYADSQWNLQFAYFANAEWGDATNLGRYSFDVVSVDTDSDGQLDRANEETNQFNLRLTREFKPTANFSIEVGGSVEWGELYNSITGDTGSHWAVAAHVNQFWGPWNFQFEGIHYEFNPRNPAGISDDLIAMGALEAARLVAAQGNILVFNVSRKFHLDWGPIETVTCYNDYSRLIKDDSRFEASQINTLGCRIPTKGAYTFIDIIAGKNTTFLNDSLARSGLGAGASDNWELRVNVNFEYYF